MGAGLPLMLDLVFYSMVEVATGFAHSFTVFLVLRALFGIGMGGEWGVGASLAMEKVPPQAAWSSVWTSSAGICSGLSSGCRLLTSSSFPRWGWRPMFFIGGLPALLGLFVRFQGERIGSLEENASISNWGDLGRAILCLNWKLFLLPDAV
jgi:SHS family lactate transporter-like MFS transporter